MNKGNSILVSRLPLWATQKEVEEAFESYGTIKNVTFVDPRSYLYSNSEFELTKSKAAVLEFAADVNRTAIVEKTNRKPFPNDKKSAPTLRVSLLEDIQQENKLFIGMIPEGTTLDELTPMFKQFGKLDEIVIIKNGDAAAKGYGFCRYDSRDNAFQAIKALNGKTYLHGSTTSLVVKFADTPNQKQNRLLRQKQTKGLDESPIANPKHVNLPLLGNDPLSYEMEYLCDYPTFSFGWEGSSYPPLSFPHCDSAPCWVDFSFCINGIDPLGLCDYPCSKEEIVTSDCYTSNCASASDSLIHIMNFPQKLTADVLLRKCKLLGNVNDVVILSRFPFSYGRIECQNRESAVSLYKQLDNMATVGWILS